jgi:hypothetical protein
LSLVGLRHKCHAGGDALPYIVALVVFALAGGLFLLISRSVGGLDAGTELNEPRVEADVRQFTTKG